ncbi:MAG TPA: MFS transporter [Ruminiclostridium sp.]
MQLYYINKGVLSMSKENGLFAYRWLILLAIAPIIISTEMMWLSLAPISSMAEHYYGVSSMSVALFSMSYMIMYIVFSLPASWVVDKFGYRYSLIIGATITAVFGLIQAFFADNFTIVLVAQFIIAIGQPFLLNISTKVPANWFPVSERSTAAGILTMAQYIGFVIPMLLAPMIAESSGIPYIFRVFAIIAVVSALIAIAFTREKPLVAPPGPVAQKEDLSLSSIKKLFSNKAFILVLFICFISIGIFNTLLTLLETILIPRGITSAQSGIVGAVFVLAGVIGAVVLPIISDKLHIRAPFFVGTIALLVPVYLGFTFVQNFVLVTILAGIAGFSIMGVAPVLFQYGSEVAYPIQEGTSFGVILLMGQISGTLFVYLFEVLQNASGSAVWPMLLVVVLTAVQLPATLRMKESSLVPKL